MTAKNTQPGQGAKEPEKKEPAKDPAAKDGTSNAKPDAKAKRQVLKVTALAETFRRANLQFGRKTRTLYLDDLSEAQVKALKGEPRLSVVEDEAEE